MWTKHATFVNTNVNNRYIQINLWRNRYFYENVWNIVIFKLEYGQFGTTFNNSNTDDFVLDITFNNIVNGFSGISCVLKLERCLLPYIMKYYLPCVAMVMVSFISFLLSLNSIPARVALLVTLFLTLTNILIAQQVWLKLHL